MADVPETPGAYLIRIDGVRSQVNGKTMVRREQPSGNGFEYWTQINGKRWNTIVVRGGSYSNYNVYVPGIRNEFGMSYNEAESKAASSAIFKK